MGHSDKKSRTVSEEQVVVLADFVEGIADSVQYAFENLVNENTRLVLLQTYERPRTGQSVIKDILPVLKRVSRQELKGIRKDLTEKYSIDPAAVETKSWEGTASDFLSREPEGERNRHIVLGLGINRITNRLRARQLVKDLEKTRPGNLYLLTGSNGSQPSDTPAFIKMNWSDSMEELDEVLSRSSVTLAILQHQTQTPE